MEVKKQSFDYTDLYRGFQRVSGAAAPSREEAGATRKARDPQLEQTLQRELEEQLKNLGQSVSEGILHGFEGRGQQLGDQAAKVGGAVWDVVTYSLGQAGDELKRAAELLKEEAASESSARIQGAAQQTRAGRASVYRSAAQTNALKKSVRKRFGIGLAQAIPGGILAFGLILAGIICLIAAPVAGPAYNVEVVNVIGGSMLISGLPFAWLTWLGGRNIGASRRIRAYAEAIGDRTGISVKALAEVVQKPVKWVRRDLKKLLGRGWMIGWLDSAEDMLYLNAEEWRAAMDRREAEVLSTDPAQQPAPNEAPKESAAVDPETIRRFVQVLGTEKQLMQDDIAVAELDKMQATSRAICEWVTTHPESAPKARRFVTYYIPTTLRLLHTYNEVKDQRGENAEAIRRDIGGILYTLNTAFANLYNALLSDMAMDVSSEIAALQGMLAQDGLSQVQNGPFA